MIHIVWGIVVIALGIVAWRLKLENSRLWEQNRTLQADLEEAIQKLAEHETQPNATEGLFEKAVHGLVALGVPGLVLLIALGTSGFAGAAAVTTALAGLGGPFGMLGGIGVLLLLALVSRAITQFGLPKLAQAVIQGLLSRGDSRQDILRKLNGIPKWIMSASLRQKIDEVLMVDSPSLTAATNR